LHALACRRHFVAKVVVVVELLSVIPTMEFLSGRGTLNALLFVVPGGAKRRTTMYNCTSENLEISGSPLGSPLTVQETAVVDRRGVLVNTASSTQMLGRCEGNVHA
jgi:hypothetical protein